MLAVRGQHGAFGLIVVVASVVLVAVASVVSSSRPVRGSLRFSSLTEAQIKTSSKPEVAV